MKTSFKKLLAEDRLPAAFDEFKVSHIFISNKELDDKIIKSTNVDNIFNNIK